MGSRQCDPEYQGVRLIEKTALILGERCSAADAIYSRDPHRLVQGGAERLRGQLHGEERSDRPA